MSPGFISSPKIAFIEASCDSNNLTFPLNFNISSSTPAVLTIHPSVAILPYKTAKPPSAEYAFLILRIHPFSRSLSNVGHNLFCENASVVRTPPGAALKKFLILSSWVEVISYLEIASSIVSECTVETFLLSNYHGLALLIFQKLHLLYGHPPYDIFGSQAQLLLCMGYSLKFDQCPS